ncbi:MAG: T9SS type A sorting domain-containing protein, partial [Gammaproteobacteria bacterium]|nr:T9SS type A sorting domain-containing protein [Gammaproteobacteria bacterium]
GDFSTFTLDSSNPITSSNNFISGSVTDLAVYDGQTFFMPLYEGTGPDVNVTINYNIDPLSDVLGDAVLHRRNQLSNAYPNPFNPSTKLSFELAAPTHARLKIYDSAGHLVTTLVDEQRSAGSHQVVWDGRNAAGNSVASGVYLYRLEVGTTVQTKRMTLVK